MAQHAVTPGDAIPYTPGSLIERRQFERMLARGVVKRGTGESYWLDAAAYREDRYRRHGRVGLIAGLLALLAAIGILFQFQG